MGTILSLISAPMGFCVPLKVAAIILFTTVAHSAVVWIRTSSDESCDTACARGSGTCNQSAMFNGTVWSDSTMEDLSAAFGCPCDKFVSSTMPSVPQTMSDESACTTQGTGTPSKGCCWYPSVQAMASDGTTGSD